MGETVRKEEIGKTVWPILGDVINNRDVIFLSNNFNPTATKLTDEYSKRLPEFIYIPSSEEEERIWKIVQEYGFWSLYHPRMCRHLHDESFYKYDDKLIIFLFQDCQNVLRRETPRNHKDVWQRDATERNDMEARCFLRSNTYGDNDAYIDYMREKEPFFSKLVGEDPEITLCNNFHLVLDDFNRRLVFLSTLFAKEFLYEDRKQLIDIMVHGDGVFKRKVHFDICKSGLSKLRKVWTGTGKDELPDDLMDDEQRNVLAD